MATITILEDRRPKPNDFLLVKALEKYSSKDLVAILVANERDLSRLTDSEGPLVLAKSPISSGGSNRNRLREALRLDPAAVVIEDLSGLQHSAAQEPTESALNRAVSALNEAVSVVETGHDLVLVAPAVTATGSDVELYRGLLEALKDIARKSPRDTAMSVSWKIIE